MLETVAFVLIQIAMHKSEACHEALRPSCLIYGATWLHKPLVYWYSFVDGITQQQTRRV